MKLAEGSLGSVLLGLKNSFGPGGRQTSFFKLRGNTAAQGFGPIDLKTSGSTTQPSAVHCANLLFEPTLLPGLGSTPNVPVFDLGRFD